MNKYDDKDNVSNTFCFYYVRKYKIECNAKNSSITTMNSPVLSNYTLFIAFCNHLIASFVPFWIKMAVGIVSTLFIENYSLTTPSS